MLVKFWGGMREDNKIKYIKCYIFGLPKEYTGYNDKTNIVQSYREMEEDVKTENKEVIDGGVPEWHN